MNMITISFSGNSRHDIVLQMHDWLNLDQPAQKPIHLSDLEFSINVAGRLRSAGFVFLDEFTDMTKEEFLRISNMGEKCAKEITEMMRLFGMNWKSS